MQVHVWDSSSAEELQQLSLAKEPARDMVPYEGANGTSHFLAVLTESRVHVYEWV